MNQRYLINGVLNTLNTKKINYHSASKGLLKKNTEKWLRAHNTKTEAASMSNARGAYFGNTRPLKRPL